MADDNTYSDPNYNNMNLKPAVSITVVGLFSLFFLAVIFFICKINQSTGDGGSRTSRRQVANRAQLTGLEQTVIESFPVFSYNDVKGLKSQAKGSECAVCLSEFENDEMVRLLPKCSHAFHPECIDMWLCSHTTCPICRVSLVPGEDCTAELPTAEAAGPTPEQVVIVVDNGSNEAPETSNDPTGHSLVMVRKEMEQGTEWYIATPRGLSRGFYRSCSFVARHHLQTASTSDAPPSGSKRGTGSVNGMGKGSKSERWGIGSGIPSSILRSLSERVGPPRGEQANRKTYLRRTFSWMLGKEERNTAERLENKSVSSRHQRMGV